MDIVTTDILKRELDRSEKKLMFNFGELIEIRVRDGEEVFEKKLNEKLEKMFTWFREDMKKVLKTDIDSAVDNFYSHHVGLATEHFQDYFQAASELTTQNTRDIKEINTRLDADIEPRLNRVVFQLKAA